MLRINSDFCDIMWTSQGREMDIFFYQGWVISVKTIQVVPIKKVFTCMTIDSKETLYLNLVLTGK